MKELKTSLVTFIDKLSSIFTDRLATMNGYKMIRAHGPMIQEVEEDLKPIEEAQRKIHALDDTSGPLALKKGLYYLLDLVLPVFRRWRVRIHQKMPHDVQSHVKPFNEYERIRGEFFNLLEALNTCENPPIIPTVPVFGTDESGHQIELRPAIAMCKQFDKEKFLTAHPMVLPAVNDASGELLTQQVPKCS